MASRLVTTAVAVQTTATQIASASRHRRSILIHNAGPNAIYIGPSTVTTGNGFPIAAGASRDFPNSPVPENLYAIAATANQSAPADTRIWETYDG